MPSNEHDPGGVSPEQERPTYYKAARFTGERPARAAYAELQRTIFRTGCDLSCFRLQLNRVWHVALLGTEPPAEPLQQLEAMLATGEAATLPADVLAFLQQRRERAVSSGALWTERHYRPRGSQ